MNTWALACRDRDVNADWFTADGNSPDANWQRNAAKAVCIRCDAFDACLAHALTHDVVGVWAATDDAERRTIRRRTGRYTT
jgi:hypothetical protein